VPISKFSNLTCERIRWYVYALSDEEGNIFYIGKGKCNRAFDHIEEVRKLIASDPAGVLKITDEEADAGVGPVQDGILGPKRQRIQAMLKADRTPTVHIVRDTLNEDEALRIESVLISVMDWQLEGALTNAVAGHGTRKHGLKSADDVEATHGEPFRLDALPDFLALAGQEVVAININRLWPQVKSGEKTLLQVSQGNWKLGLARAKRCRYAIVHANNVVRGVFRIARWREAAVGEGRIMFDAEGGRELAGDAFQSKDAASLFGPSGAGSQNPIRYIKLATD
jgi:hypothetical protein